MTTTKEKSVKAYLDTFDGLIPCVITHCNDSLSHIPELAGRSSSCLLEVRLTADRGAYRKGEIIQSNALRVIPRNAVYQSSGQYRIRPYVWNIVALSNLNSIKG